METPSSIRRFTRSQAMVAANDSVPISKKIEDSDLGVSKSRTRKGNQNQERSYALVDITNGSPIVGLAIGTPSSGISKSSRVKKTPGSGEALLRGQVKTLLQKVEEEAELSKLSLERRPVLNIKNFVNSPMGLLAPTPANTPQIPNFSGDGSLTLISVSPVSEEELMMISEVESEISDGKKEDKALESQKSLITRSLLLDFSEKSESDSSDSWECSSVITTVKSESNEKGKHIRFVYSGEEEDHDDASIWSIQANASTQDEDDEEVIEEEEEEEEDEYYEDEAEEVEEDGGNWVDELCAGISKISVKEGKHTRFVYNSEDEIEKVELVLKLKGMPSPKGKHLRFPLEEEDEEDN